MHDEMAKIADRVRGVVAEKRCNQKALASILGISRQSVNQRLNARVPFSGVELLRLSVALVVPIDRFFPSTEALRLVA
jgi:transcriptional regulator with XRE-family HTH domain